MGCGKEREWEGKLGWEEDLNGNGTVFLGGGHYTSTKNTAGAAFTLVIGIYLLPTFMDQWRYRSWEVVEDTGLVIVTLDPKSST